MRKYLSLLMAGVLAVSMLGGCGSAFDDGSSTGAAAGDGGGAQTQAGASGETTPAAAGSGAAAGGNVIHIPEKDEFPTVDCQKDTEFYVVPLNIYDRLVECEVVDGVATIVPSLAKSWDISPDGLVYTFHLRDDVTFHNGARFTADDVVYTVERMMNPSTAALNTDFFSMIKGAGDMLDGQAEGVEGVKALDDYTVEITLEVPFAPFLANLATPSCSIYNREATEAAGDQFGIDPAVTVGTGPFKITDWVLNDRITLARNDDYFKGPAKIDGIELIQVPDENTQKLMYENGELDVVDLSSSTSQLAYFMGNETYKDNLVTGPEAGNYFYAFNLDMKPTDDVRVRKAISMAIDRQTILDQMYNGAGHVVNSMLPDGVLGSYDAQEIPYDPEGAKALLAEAGYGDGCDLEIYQKTDDPDALAINQVIMSMLGQVGINATIKQMDEAAYLSERREGNIGMTRAVWWADFNDPDNFLYTFFTEKNTKARSINHKNGDVYQWLEDARAMVDEDERMALYQKIDTTMVQDEAAVFPLYQMDHIVVVQDWVKGFEIPWNGWTDTSYYNVSIER
ncbi:MAG: ABC transporter substrate-binding protein [Hungatella sp.]|nr:ABC transporter substrate-binding protein [Hungatella sp.]